MKDIKNLLKQGLLVLLILCALAHTAFAEEAPGSVDRSISILNIVATCIAVLVGLITIIIMIGIALGFFEFRRWKAIRKEIKKDAKDFKKLRNNLEEYLDTARNKMEKISRPPLTEEPPKEFKEKLEEHSRRLEFLELFGVPLKAEDYFNRATDLYYKGRYEEALKAIVKAIELKPDYAVAWSNKGLVLGKLGRHDEALKAYNKAIELKPDDAEAWYNKGVVLGKLGCHEETLKAYDKVTELKPDDARAWCNKGATLYNLDRNNEALKACDKAIELKPDDAKAWCNKGLVLGKLGRHDEALEALANAIGLEPDAALSWYNRARIYSIKGEKKMALSDLKRAIELDVSQKEKAKTDEDFKNLWDDEDFKKLVG